MRAAMRIRLCVVAGVAGCCCLRLDFAVIGKISKKAHVLPTLQSLLPLFTPHITIALTVHIILHNGSVLKPALSCPKH